MVICLARTHARTSRCLAPAGTFVSSDCDHCAMGKYRFAVFSIFRLRTLTGSNVAAFLMGTMLFSMFLLLTLYMQQVLGYSAMKTGIAYLACAGTAIIWANVAAQLVTSGVMDHFGLFGSEAFPMSPARFVGMGLLCAGAVLVVRG